MIPYVMFEHERILSLFFSCSMTHFTHSYHRYLVSAVPQMSRRETNLHLHRSRRDRRINNRNRSRIFRLATTITNNNKTRTHLPRHRRRQAPRRPVDMVTTTVVLEDDTIEVVVVPWFNPGRVVLPIFVRSIS